MLWSRLDYDITRDPAFIALEDQVPGGFWMFVHLLEFARIANNQGRVLHRNRPMKVKDFATLTRQDESRWAQFFEEAFALGVVEQDDHEGALCYRVADWKRWHVAPSDTPEAIRDRVQRHRDSKREFDVTGVTECNGCNDTQHSIAEHEQSTVKHQHQQSTAQEDECPADTAAAAEGWGSVVKVLLELQPGSSGSAKFRQSVANWCAARQDRAKHIDYLTAAAYAVAEVRHQWHLGKTVTNPLTYGLTIAQNHLAPATERRIGNEVREKAGLSTAPYVWEPPKEERQSA